MSVPFQPGSQKPAVAWTMSPRRPIELLPSIRATMSSGSSTHSSVRPRQNSPGWMTKDSSRADHHLLGQPGRRLAQVDGRGAMVVEDPEGVTQAQIDAGRLNKVLVPGVDPDPAVAHELEDRAVGQDGGRRRAHGGKCASPSRHHRAIQCSNVRARARTVRTRAGGAGGGIPVGSTTGQAGEGPWADGDAGPALDAALVVGIGRVLRLLLDRPPDDVDQAGQRQLERKHQPQKSPRHVRS